MSSPLLKHIPSLLTHVYVCYTVLTHVSYTLHKLPSLLKRVILTPHISPSLLTHVTLTPLLFRHFQALLQTTKWCGRSWLFRRGTRGKVCLRCWPRPAPLDPWRDPVILMRYTQVHNAYHCFLCCSVLQCAMHNPPWMSSNVFPPNTN